MRPDSMRAAASTANMDITGEEIAWDTIIKKDKGTYWEYARCVSFDKNVKVMPATGISINSHNIRSLLL